MVLTVQQKSLQELQADGLVCPPLLNCKNIWYRPCCLQVTVLGTPGEDCGHGSKIDMLQAGVFQDIDFCMMLEPFNQNILYPKHFNLVVVDVTYKGKSSHASASPWEGRNALDAAVACYNNVALLRQHLKPQWSINGLFSCIPQFWSWGKVILNTFICCKLHHCY